jgi:hypothetical protein
MSEHSISISGAWKYLQIALLVLALTVTVNMLMTLHNKTSANEAKIDSMRFILDIERRVDVLEDAGEAECFGTVMELDGNQNLP